MTDAATPALSIVVPIGPGDESWRELLPALLAEVDQASEVILSATTPEPELGGYRRDPGVVLRWVEGGAGRGAQLNRAAAAARGAFLWFLHADSTPVPGSVRRLLAALREAPDALWYFDLRFRPDGPPLMVVNQAGARLRSRWLGLPFGDQGLALSRKTLEGVGRFREDVMHGEDHRLVWAARRAGHPVRAVGLPLYTSARRYRDSGWALTTVRSVLRTFAQGLPEAWRWVRGR